MSTDKETLDEDGYSEEEQAEYDKVFNGEEDETNDDDGEEVEADVSEDDVAETPEDEPQDEDEVVSDELEDPEPDPEPEVETKGDMWTLKWRGKEIEVTQEEAINMAQQNFDSTKKWQEASDMKKEVKKEMELLERAKSGDKKALAQIIKQSEVDPVDLLDLEDEDTEDIEQGTGKPAEPFVSSEVAEMMEEVAQDDQLFGKLQDLERELPESVINIMAKDPETFYAVVTEVRSGDADIVLPQVQLRMAQLAPMERTLVTNDPNAFANFYINVKSSMIEEQNKQNKKSVPEKSKVNPNEVSVRKSGRSRPRGESKQDSFNSDEAYQAILNRLEGTT